MTETQHLKWRLNLATHTVKQLEERIKRKDAIILELREKLRECKKGRYNAR